MLLIPSNFFTCRFFTLSQYLFANKNMFEFHLLSLHRSELGSINVFSVIEKLTS
jgi:hypothetical protein